MALDLVYLVRRGPNPELQHSLRSVAANLEHGEVHMLGERPAFTRNVRSIRTPQHGSKHENTNAALLHACSRKLLPETFVLMNDDFFAMRPTTVPRAHRGLIADVLDEYQQRGKHSDYVVGMGQTLELLQRWGFEKPKSYELHVPLVIERDVMADVLQRLRGERIAVPHKRSIYGNVAKAGGRKMRDVKVATRNAPLPSSAWVSTSDLAFHGVAGKAVRAAFPQRCRYEG